MIGYLDSGFSIEIPEGGKLTHWRALQCETNNGARGNNKMFNVKYCFAQTVRQLLHSGAL